MRAYKRIPEEPRVVDDGGEFTSLAQRIAQWCIEPGGTLRMGAVWGELIVRRGIVVESCPSSNCVVAGFDVPPLLSLLENKDLRVVVGTDDPGIFEAWPDQGLGRLDDEKRKRVLEEAERSSFVWRI